MRFAYAYKGWNVYLDDVKLGGINACELPTLGSTIDELPVIALNFFTASEDFFAVLNGTGKMLTVKAATCVLDHATKEITTESEIIFGKIAYTRGQLGNRDGKIEVEEVEGKIRLPVGGLRYLKPGEAYEPEMTDVPIELKVSHSVPNACVVVEATLSDLTVHVNGKQMYSQPATELK
jgi:hypothetical protein